MEHPQKKKKKKKSELKLPIIPWSNLKHVWFHTKWILKGMRSGVIDLRKIQYPVRTMFSLKRESEREKRGTLI